MAIRQGIGLMAALLVAACGDDTAPAEGTGGAPGSGGTSGKGECAVNADSSAAPVAFKTQVMPIFGRHCAGSSCHSTSGRSKAGLYLGPKCNDVGGVCTYAAAPDTENPNESQPLTDANVMEVWTALRAASATAPAVKRVEAGNVEASFLVDKIVGTQSDKNLTCTNTDGAGTEPCGVPMPYLSDSLCAVGASGQGKVNTIVNWIAQGAENN
jgi:hypothetical protein